MILDRMTQETATVNTRVNLPSYRSFEIVGADVDEIAAKWKKWKRGLNYYIESIAIDKVAEKSRLKNMVFNWRRCCRYLCYLDRHWR